MPALHDSSPTCPFALQPLSHVFRLPNTSSPSIDSSHDLACIGGRARPYSERDMLAWAEHGLECLAWDSEEEEGEDAHTRPSTDEPTTPVDLVVATDAEPTPKPALLPTAVVRLARGSLEEDDPLLPEDRKALAALLCPATHYLPPTPKSKIFLLKDLSDPTLQSVEVVLEGRSRVARWVKEQSRRDGCRGPVNTVAQSGESRVRPGRTAPPPTPTSSAELGRLVQLEPAEFVFPSCEEKEVSKTIVLRNTADRPVAYKVTASPPSGMNTTERAQYVSMFRVRNSSGVLAKKDEVRLRAMYFSPCPDLVRKHQGQFTLTLRVAPLLASAGAVPPVHTRAEVGKLLNTTLGVQSIEIPVLLPRPSADLFGSEDLTLVASTPSTPPQQQLDLQDAAQQDATLPVQLAGPEWTFVLCFLLLSVGRWCLLVQATGFRPTTDLRARAARKGVGC